VQVEGGKVIDARVAYGGMAAIPSRAPQAEAALIGQPWSMATIEAAMAALAQDFKPITDLRASREYRLQAAASHLRRFYLQHAGEPMNLRTSDALASLERTS
jgi:xanthine dehydrogenase small subunit